jgi:hypothetical protein
MSVSDGVLREQDWDNVEIEALLVRARSKPVEGQDSRREPKSRWTGIVTHHSSQGDMA